MSICLSDHVSVSLPISVTLHLGLKLFHNHLLRLSCRFPSPHFSMHHIYCTGNIISLSFSFSLLPLTYRRYSCVMIILYFMSVPSTTFLPFMLSLLHSHVICFSLSSFFSFLFWHCQLSWDIHSPSFVSLPLLVLYQLIPILSFRFLLPPVFRSLFTFLLVFPHLLLPYSSLPFIYFIHFPLLLLSKFISAQNKLFLSMLMSHPLPSLSLFTPLFQHSGIKKQRRLFSWQSLYRPSLTVPPWETEKETDHQAGKAKERMHI